MAKPKQQPATSAKAQAADRQAKGAVVQPENGGVVENAKPALSQVEVANLDTDNQIARENLKNAREKLAALVAAVDALVADSLGVYGLHANGDMAPWPEVLESRFPMLADARSIGRP